MKYIIIYLVAIDHILRTKGNFEVLKLTCLFSGGLGIFGAIVLPGNFFNTFWGLFQYYAFPVLVMIALGAIPVAYGFIKKGIPKKGK